MESKIAMTDRLRREGRWQDACLCREDERKRLREGGASRQESNDIAWELMVEVYSDHLTDDQIDWYEASQATQIADLPPNCDGVDHESEPSMRDVWWAYCTLKACNSRMQKNDAEGAKHVRDCMWQCSPTPGAETLNLLAAADPVQFLDQVVIKFNAAIQRIDNESFARRDLLEHLDHIKKMRADLVTRTKTRELDIAETAPRRINLLLHAAIPPRLLACG